jgi:hypothetical protein
MECIVRTCSTAEAESVLEIAVHVDLYSLVPGRVENSIRLASGVKLLELATS